MDADDLFGPKYEEDYHAGQITIIGIICLTKVLVIEVECKRV